MSCGIQPSSRPTTPQPPLIMGDSGSLPHPNPHQTTSQSISVLSDPNSTYSERIVAANELEKEGLQAEAAVPILIDNLHHNDSEVRIAVTKALGAIGPGARPAVPILIQTLLSKQSVRERRVVATALGKISDTSAVPFLAKGLDDEDIAIECAKAMGLLTRQEFPDIHSTSYVIENGVPRIVTAARIWWGKQGQYQDWRKH